MKWRFLLFVLFTAALPLLVSLVATGDVSLHAEERLETRITGASSAVQVRLDLEAARRRELLLRVSMLEGATQPLRDAARDGVAPGAAAVARLRQTISDLFSREVPVLLGVATAAGAQVVLSGNEPRVLAVTDLPLASATLRGGEFTESFAVFEGSLFRFFAAPVGIGEGALVIGDRVGENTANRLRDETKVESITFVSGGQAVVSTLPEGERAFVAAAALAPNFTLSTGRLGTGMPGFGFLDDYFPLMVPPARFRSLSRDIGGGVSAVVTIASDDELGWLGRTQLFAIGLSMGAFLLGLVWLTVIYGPVTRQARSVEAHLARLRVERGTRLGTRGFTKPFLTLAQELDRLTDTWSQGVVEPPVEKTPTPKAEGPIKPIQRPIDLVLAPMPSDSLDSSEGTPSAFPFGEAPAIKPAVSNPVLDEAEKTPRPAPLPFADAKKLGPSAEARRAPGAPFEEPVEQSSGEPTGPVPLPAPGAKHSFGKDPFVAFGPAPDADTGDRTREAMIPPELLVRSRELEEEMLEPPVDPDEEHFKQVFEAFVATRKRCNEPPDAGLTLDKFTGRLKRNREQLVTKYSCRTVRFHVYVKEGKAAVKAAPVK